MPEIVFRNIDTMNAYARAMKDIKLSIYNAFQLNHFGVSLMKHRPIQLNTEVFHRIKSVFLRNKQVNFVH